LFLFQRRRSRIGGGRCFGGEKSGLTKPALRTRRGRRSPSPRADRFDLAAPDLERRALQWSQLRGARSGRVAWQFIRDLAGELGKAAPV